jgi:hypothetical protein
MTTPDWRILVGDEHDLMLDGLKMPLESRLTYQNAGV